MFLSSIFCFNYNYIYLIIIYFFSIFRKSKYLFPTISLATPNENREHPQFITRAPENAAVHFGDFYGLQNNNVEKAYHNNAEEETTMIKKKRRSNFTRQMVHK